MLRDLAVLDLSSDLHVFFKRRNETLHIAETAHSKEPAIRFVQRGSNPAQDHLVVTPAVHLACVARDQAVHVLDRLGRPRCSVERAIDAQDGERDALGQPAARGLRLHPDMPRRPDNEEQRQCLPSIESFAHARDERSLRGLSCCEVELWP